jgi:hypothetical protein
MDKQMATNEFSDDDLLTDFEREERKHAAIIAKNLFRERRQVAARNRRAGHAEPKPGDVLHVSLARGLTRRARAGVMFTKGPSVPVEVTDLTDADVLEAQKRGKAVVNTTGAELILDDDSLNVRSAPTADEDVDAIRGELERTKEENASLVAELQRLRDARRAAPESTDGRSTRLAAARKAGEGERTLAGAALVDEPSFTDPDAKFATAPSTPAPDPAPTNPTPPTKPPARPPAK